MLKEGAYFGEMALLEHDRVASAHVVADCVVDLQALWQVDFFDVLKQHPSLELEINKEIGKAGYLEQNQAFDGRTRITRKRVGFEHMIGDLPLFACCSPRVLQAIKGSTKPIAFEHGEAILRMGETASGLYIITEGTCEVKVPSMATEGADAAAKRPHQADALETVRTLRTGDWFGELSLINNQPVSAHVVAYGPCAMQMLSKAAYDSLRQAHPELTMQLKAAVEEMDYQNLSPFAMEVPFFKGCPAHLVKAVMKRLEHRSYDPGQHIVQRGAAGKGLFFVSMGECQVRIQNVGKDGQTNTKTARVLKEGAHFGELSLLEPMGLAQADVVVTSDGPCVLHVLPKTAYRQVLAEHPSFEEHLRNVSERANYGTLTFLVTSVPLFTYCTPEIVEAIVAKLRVETYQPSAYIIQRGRLGRALYVVRKGLCHAMVEAGDELKVVGSIKEGGQFGELSLMFPERPTAAHVVAVDPVEVLVLLRTDFEALRMGNPQLQECLSKRVKEMKYEELHYFNTRCSVFSEALGRDALSELIGHLKLVKHQAGVELVTPAAPCKALTFLKAGECIATEAGEAATPNASRLLVGAIYGEAVLSSGDEAPPPPTRVVARTSVEVYVLAMDAVRKLGAENPELLEKVQAACIASRTAAETWEPTTSPVGRSASTRRGGLLLRSGSTAGAVDRRNLGRGRRAVGGRDCGRDLVTQAERLHAVGPELLMERRAVEQPEALGLRGGGEGSGRGRVQAQPRELARERRLLRVESGPNAKAHPRATSIARKARRAPC